MVIRTISPPGTHGGRPLGGISTLDECATRIHASRRSLLGQNPTIPINETLRCIPMVPPSNMVYAFVNIEPLL